MILGVSLVTGCDIIIDLITPPPVEGPPPAGILFFDDFEDGADPAWSAASGTWLAERGRFTVQETGDAWYKVYVKTSTSLQWKDYAVEVDIWDGDKTWQGGIIVRAQDDRNHVMLEWGYFGLWPYREGLGLYVWRDGIQHLCEEVGPGLTARARVRVEVVGNTYTVYVRQGEEGELVKRLWCEDDTFTQGMPGLALQNKDWRGGNVSFDNFKVISLHGQ
jgi:hypothetical protein